MKALLGEELPDVGRGLPTPPSPNAHSKPAGSGDPALQQTTRHIPAAVWAIVAVVVALIAFIVLRPRRSPEEIAQLVAKAQALAANAAAKSAPATPASPRLAPAPTAPVSPAREWVAKARALYEPWDFATPEDFKQAEQFLKRAIDLDPSDAEAWASLAILSCGSYFMPHDRTPARAKDARFQAERAVKLAPNSDYALFAQAFAMRIEPLTRADAIRRLRELVARQPRDKLMSRILGAALAQNQETEQEGLAFLARAAALPGGDPIAEFLQGDTLRRDRYDEAIAAYDRALALAPNYDQAHRAKISVLLQTLGDPIAARAALEKVSPTLLHDDRMAAVAVTVWFAVNEPERVLRVLDQGSAYFARIYLNGPTAYWKGLAHRRAGRLQAAQVEWRVALKEVQRLHEANPTAPRELLWKARLHALLGERKEAETALALHGQFVTQVDATTAIERLEAGNLVDTPDQAVREITELFSIERNRRAVAAAILFDPALDPVRDHPQFAPLVEQAKAYYAEVRKKSAEQK